MHSILPPSPNWNCSRVIDCDSTGVLCFASRDSVYVWDLSVDLNTCPTIVARHKGRVNGVSIRAAGQGDSYRICSGGIDSSVKVTEFSANKEPKMLAEHSFHKQQVLVVHFSPVDENLVASGDEKGCLIVWNSASNEMISWKVHHSDNAITSLTFAPGTCGRIAVGLKAGTIFVLKANEKQFEVVHKFREHTGEIVSLHWIVPNLRSDEALELLTSGQDGTIRTWNVESGKVEKVLTNADGSQTKSRNRDVRQRKWFATSGCAWSSDEFMSGGANGQLHLWNLQEGKSQCLQDIKGHNKMVFNVVTWISKRGSKMAASISMDRQLIVWNVDDMKVAFSLPTLGGFVYSISHSPISPDTFALGVGDNTIKVFTLQKNICCNFTTISQNIKFKVTSLLWHPRVEKMLAFGTEDGTIGIVRDVASRSGGVVEISATFHNKAVYSLVWGPRLGYKSRGDERLYSVGGSSVFMHDPASLQTEAVDVGELIRRKCLQQAAKPTEMTFSPDGEFVAFGHDDGSIDIRSTVALDLACQLRHCNKIINSISWHHDSTSDSGSSSNCSNWIAVASNSRDVCVFGLDEAVGEWKESGVTRVLTECMAELRGHSLKVSKVLWSPNHDGLLASASSDRTVQIWNVLEKKGIGNYRGHHGQVLSLSWGCDGESVYSGGEDFTFQGWRFGELGQNMPPPKRLRKVVAAGRSENSTNGIKSPDNGESFNDEDEEEEPSERAGSHQIPPSTVSHKEDEPSTRAASSKSVEKTTKRKFRSLLPVSNSVDSLDINKSQLECISLAAMLYSGKNVDRIELDDKSFHLGCYVNRRGVRRLFEHESENHSSKDHFDWQFVLQSFQGLNGTQLREIARSRKLNDHVVSAACSVSVELWEELCLDYANQLKDEGQYLKASTYLLNVGKVAEAINLLIESKHYKEAICLARARLHTSHPLLRSCYLSGAEAFAQNGNYEQACKCLLAAGKPNEAVAVLLRRSEPSTYRVAYMVAKETGNVELSSVYANGYVRKLLSDCRWSDVGTFLAAAEDVEHLSLLLCVHEVLSSFLAALLPGFGDYLGCRSALNVTGDVPSVLLVVLEIFVRDWWSASRKTANICDVRGRLLEIHSGRQPQQDLRNRLVDVSLCISLFVSEHLAASRRPENEGGSPDRWILDAFSMLEGCGDADQLLCTQFCHLLFPDGSWSAQALVGEMINIFLHPDRKRNSEIDPARYFPGEHDNRENEEDPAKEDALKNARLLNDSIRKMVAAFDKLPQQLAASDEPVTLADCVDAKCCWYSINALFPSTATQRDGFPVGDVIRGDQSQRIAAADDILSNFNDIDFDLLVRKASSLLLRKGPARMQATLKVVDDINRSCKQLIAKGGSYSPPHQVSHSANIDAAAGDANACPTPHHSNGSIEKNICIDGDADILPKSGPEEEGNQTAMAEVGGDGAVRDGRTTLIDLAQRLQENKNILRTFPDHYRTFPDCTDSAKLLTRLSRSTSHSDFEFSPNEFYVAGLESKTGLNSAQTSPS